MRPVTNLSLKSGIAAVVRLQFELAAQVAEHGPLTLIEGEVSIKSPDKAGADAILLYKLAKGLDALPAGTRVMLKLTIPDVPAHYSGLTTHDRVIGDQPRRVIRAKC